MMSSRQQKMLIYLLRNSTLTRKEQSLYLSPFFYTQISELVKKGFAESTWRNGSVEWSLTTRGKATAEILEDTYGREVVFS